MPPENLCVKSQEAKLENIAHPKEFTSPDWMGINQG